MSQSTTFHDTHFIFQYYLEIFQHALGDAFRKLSFFFLFLGQARKSPPEMETDLCKYGAHQILLPGLIFYFCLRYHYHETVF